MHREDEQPLEAHDSNRAPPLANPSGALWIGQVATYVSMGLMTFCIGLWLLERQQSLTGFAFVAVSTTLPQALVAPWAGVLADRYDGRKLTRICDLASMAGLAVLAASCADEQFMPEVVFPAILLLDAIGCIRWSAYFSLLTRSAPDEKLTRITGLNQVSQAVGQFLPLLVGGLLLQRTSLPTVFFVCGVLHLVSLTAAVGTRTPSAGRLLPSTKTRVWDNFRFGGVFVMGDARLRGLLVFQLCASFLGALVIVMATPMVLNFASPETAGVVLALGGCGMVVGGLGAGTLFRRVPRWRALLWAVMFGGIVLIAVAIHRTLFTVAVGGFLYFSVLYGINSLSDALWLSRTPPASQGRVIAFRNACLLLVQTLGFAVAGPAVERGLRVALEEPGTPLVVALSLLGEKGLEIGALYLLVGLSSIALASVAWRSRTLRGLERPPEESKP